MPDLGKPYATGDRGDALFEDPLLGFNFQLKIEGHVAGYFTECSGVGSEHEVIEHKVVDKQGHEIVRKIPGRLKWQDITLKRGITSDLEIWKWRQEVVEGKLSDARKNISIQMMSCGFPMTPSLSADGWYQRLAAGLGLEGVGVRHVFFLTDRKKRRLNWNRNTVPRMCKIVGPSPKPETAREGDATT